ncbi:hypothetical protein Q9292_08535 [Methylophilus sp. VKM B-3414]|uniref:hypothetical protein n=1 Tax=Methylophilus sp. VKM B-3414 TaxID=3076121 RepID=UPI0028C8F04F|nr:hypothetical protein [Methylophilus sp. VKM B-3414]MDT7849653.1 hypothetical protein [Methylophilus sp. VKM B-3414]
MKKLALAIVLTGLYALNTTSVFATGLVAIPSTGFSESAYTLCNTTGNFGSSVSTQPTTTANNTCAVFPTNEATPPVAGYTLIAAVVRNAVVGGVTVGTVSDRVWRNAAQNSCIFGARFSAANADYDAGTMGTQYFEVNDIARGGFGSALINAGYFIQAVNASPVYRIGRTFTSVQHRANIYNGNAGDKLLPGANYLSLPIIGGASTLAINGETTSVWPSSTTAVKQSAAINSNWVDFTLEAVYLENYELRSSVNSPMVYVEAACDSSNVSSWVKSGAIRLRQTGQEGESLIEISVDGYAPPGAVLP